MNEIYTFISVIIISLVSVVAAIPLLIKKKVSKNILVFLLSMSVGVLLSSVFMNFLPEIIHHHGYTIDTAVYILTGFLIMFVIEKFVHAHHNKKCETDDCGHGHAYNLAPINLIGDGIHNFIDGLVVAGSFAVSTTLGITTTISIIFHEIPQEIADFGVLLYAGMSKKKALLFNLLSATTAILGAFAGMFMISGIHWFNSFIIPFAAGNFLYIAATNLLPQLHRHCNIKESLLHMIAIGLGIMIIISVTHLGPAHSHG